MGKINTVISELKVLPKYISYIFSGGKKAIYIGCLGHNNIGDDVVFQAIKIMIAKKIRLYEIDYSRQKTGRIWRELFFPYPDYIIVGGGTIIKKKANESYLRLILQYYQKYPKAKILVLGSGVADTVLAEKIGFPTDIKAWREILNKSHYIGVRGPLSVSDLINWGVDKPINILFDPALYLQQKLQPKSKTKTIGVNFCNIIDRVYGFDQNKVEKFATELLYKLLDSQWNIVLYPTTSNDIPYMQHFLPQKILKEIRIFNYSSDIDKMLQFYDTIDVFLGMRLHSIIFSSLRTTPFYAIEYEQKTSDFLQSIALNNSQIRTDELDVDKVFSEINTIYSNLEVRQNELFALVSQAKNKQEQIVKDFLESV